MIKQKYAKKSKILKNQKTMLYKKIETKLYMFLKITNKIITKNMKIKKFQSFWSGGNEVVYSVKQS